MIDAIGNIMTVVKIVSAFVYIFAVRSIASIAAFTCTHIRAKHIPTKSLSCTVIVLTLSTFINVFAVGTVTAHSIFASTSKGTRSIFAVSIVVTIMISATTFVVFNASTRIVIGSISRVASAIIRAFCIDTVAIIRTQGLIRCITFIKVAAYSSIAFVTIIAITNETANCVIACCMSVTVVKISYTLVEVV